MNNFLRFNIHILFFNCKVTVCTIYLLDFFGVCFEINFTLIKRLYYHRMASNWGLYLTRTAFEMWAIVSVQNLQLQGTSVHNDHLRGPVILTPVATIRCYCWAVTICFKDSRGWDSNSQPSVCEAIAALTDSSALAAARLTKTPSLKMARTFVIFHKRNGHLIPLSCSRVFEFCISIFSFETQYIVFKNPKKMSQDIFPILFT